MRFQASLLGPLLLTSLLVPGAVGGDPQLADRSLVQLRAAVDPALARAEGRGEPLEDVLLELSRRFDFALELELPLPEPVTTTLEEPALRQLLERLLRGHHFVFRHGPSAKLWVIARVRTSRAVSRTGTAEAAAALLPPPRQRQDVRALADRDDADSMAALTAIPLRDRDPKLREEAAHALGELACEESVPVLERALGDSASQVRQAAIQALEDIGGERAAWSLSVALDDSRSEIRREAVDALDWIGGDVALTIVREALADESDSVRAAAAQVLLEHADP